MTGIPPGLVNGSAATRANATHVSTIFCIWLFLALIIADHVRPVESQILYGENVKSVPWANLKSWSDRQIFVQQMGGRLSQLLANRFAERARSAVSVRVEPCLVMIGRPIGRGSHSRHQNRAPENPQEMVVHLVVEPPLTLFIGARHRADV